MELLAAAQQAELHRELYVAIIHSCTRARGAKQALADRAKISRQHLRYVCVLDSDADSLVDTRRQLSVESARRLSSALPLPPEQRARAFYHMLMSLENEERARQGLTRVLEDLPNRIWDVRHLAHRATHLSDPILTQARYRSVVWYGRFLAHAMSVREWPIEYVELCLCLHDALCVLDDPVSALRYGRQAEVVLDWVDPARYRGNEEHVQALEINTRRSIGVAYNNLELPKQAAAHFDRARLTTAFKRDPGRWNIHLARDHLSTLAKLPRFPISEAEGRALQALDGVGDGHEELYELLLKAKLGECYLAYGSPLNRAGPPLEALIEKAESSTVLGAFHRVIIYRTYASLCRERQDEEGFILWLHRALSVASGAGLGHQIRTIRHEVVRGEWATSVLRKQQGVLAPFSTPQREAPKQA